MGTSRVDSLTTRMPNFTQEQVRREPCLFDCDWRHAQTLGGPIAAAFLDRLPEDWTSDPTFSVDSWITHVERGWFPRRPIWTRTGTITQRHTMAFVNGEIAHEEFAIGRYMPAHSNEDFDQWISKQIGPGELQLWIPRADRFFVFDGHAIHRPMPAEGSGWSWTGLATIGNRTIQHSNERLRQTQIYAKEQQ